MSGGNANRIMPPTTSTYHPYSGIKLMRMPGGRHFSTPTISSTAAAIEATSINDSPKSQMSEPMPSASVASGGYMNQPLFGATPNRIEPMTNTPPMMKHQNP